MVHLLTLSICFLSPVLIVCQSESRIRTLRLKLMTVNKVIAESLDELSAISNEAGSAAGNGNNNGNCFGNCFGLTSGNDNGNGNSGSSAQGKAVSGNGNGNGNCIGNCFGNTNGNGNGNSNVGNGQGGNGNNNGNCFGNCFDTKSGNENGNLNGNTVESIALETVFQSSDGNGTLSSLTCQSAGFIYVVDSGSNCTVVTRSGHSLTSQAWPCPAGTVFDTGICACNHKYMVNIRTCENYSAQSESAPPFRTTL